MLRVRAAARAQGKPMNGEVPPVPVSVGLQTEDGYPHAGVLDLCRYWP